MSFEPRTRWATRAIALYTDAYAERYRAHDESPGPTWAVARLSNWLRTAAERFVRPIDVLDLGCGTGRYFHTLAAAPNVRRLVGIDVSRPMLDRARRPTRSVATSPGWLTLIEDDFLTHEFDREGFDLVYAIGVLAEHSPFDDATVARVKRWLKPGGRFAFTTVHPLSASVPRTLKRRLGEWLLPLASVAPGHVRRGLRTRLSSGGLYADEQRVREVLAAADLTVESIQLFESDVHLHVLAVALKQVGT